MPIGSAHSVGGGLAAGLPRWRRLALPWRWQWRTIVLSYGRILGRREPCGPPAWADCSVMPEMDAGVVGVAGALAGVLLGTVAQQLHASRSPHWQQADLLRTVKRGVLR